MCTTSSKCIVFSGGCVSGLCVEGSGRLGDSCTVSTDCNTGFTCSSGKCKIAQGSMIPCCDDDMCASGSFCMDQVCTVETPSSSSSSSRSSRSSRSSSSSSSCGMSMSSSCSCGPHKSCRECRAKGKVLPSTSKYY